MAQQADLYSPVRVFYQNVRKGFCIASNNGNNFNKTLNLNYTVTNASQFLDTFSLYTNQSYSGEKTYLYTSKTFSQNIPLISKNSFDLYQFNGYSPIDQLVSMSVTLYSNFSTLNVPSVNSYGNCNNNLNFSLIK